MRLKYGGKTLSQVIKELTSLNENIDHQKIL
jgi:hypothetical protein